MPYLVRLAFAALGLGALGRRLMYTAANDHSVANFLSYFSEESTALAVVVLGVWALGSRRGWTPTRTDVRVRGAATVAMVITGIVYVTVLRDAGSGSDERWISYVLHYVLPIYMVVDWLVERRAPRAELRDAPWWLLFPALYAGYTALRGSITDWYPYPFLDPHLHSTGRIVVNDALVLVLAVVVSVALVALQRPRAATPATLDSADDVRA